MIPLDRLLVSVTTRGNVSTEIVTAWQDLHEQHGVPLPVWSRGHLTACDARNKLRSLALAGDYDALLMVDDDVRPDISVIRMAQLGKPLTAAPVMIMHPDVNVPFFNIYFQPKGEDGWLPHPGQFAAIGTGLERVDAVGFGAVAIRTDVLRTLPPFWLTLDAAGIAVRSEDLPYCEMALKLGYEVWVDWNARALHRPIVELQELQERNALAFAKYQR